MSMYEPEEITLQIESQEIQAKTRKLKGTWTYECQQDMRTWVDPQAAQQLTDIMAAEIAAEIDQEILNDLRNNADKPWGVKKKRQFRSITDDWEIQRVD